MKQKSIRVFRDLPENFQYSVNHFAHKVKEACEKGSLPLSYGPHLKGKLGNWTKTLDSKPSELICEVGCHKGLNLNQMAANHKEHGFIGFDITFKRVHETAALAKEKNLNNLHAIMADAKEMEHIFAAGELTGVIIFFPDPWIKKKSQTKKRLINAEFCAILKKVLKPNGFIWFKTDSIDYFMNTQTLLLEAGFIEGSLKHTCFTENYESTFEKRFKEKGEPTYESIWIHPENA